MRYASPALLDERVPLKKLPYLSGLGHPACLRIPLDGVKLISSRAFETLAFRRPDEVDVYDVNAAMLLN